MSISSSCGGGRGDLAVDVVVRDGHDVLVVAVGVVDGGGGVGGVGGGAVEGRSGLRTAFQGAGQPALDHGGGIQWVVSSTLKQNCQLCED